MKISKDARRTSKELFQNSFVNGRLDPARVKATVSKIVELKPGSYLSILKDYQRLVRLEVEKHHAIIESATPLDGKAREQLEAGLRAKHSGDFTTEYKVTPDLIGGVRVKLGSDVWDSSVRSRLAALENSFARS